MGCRIKYTGKSGQELKFSIVRPDGTPKGAPLQPLPETSYKGFYIAISSVEIENGDTVVIHPQEAITYDGVVITYNGEIVTVDGDPIEGITFEIEKSTSTTPSDLIDLAKAVNLYHRSRAQIKRDIEDQKISDYRKMPTGKHWISKKEADEFYIPK